MPDSINYNIAMVSPAKQNSVANLKGLLAITGPFQDHIKDWEWSSPGSNSDSMKPS